MPSSHPLVSIIVPTYNRADYIIETIESVREQTYSHWELIIMDDGSEDKTEELIQGLNDNRIFFYKQERTGKVGRLKNEGMKKARGEMIAFIDSDDLWAKDKLEKQLSLLQKFPTA